jgi:ribonuclease-3
MDTVSSAITTTNDYEDNIARYDVPYNPNNRVVSLEDVCKILNRYGVQEMPNDISLYRKAFLHRSYCTRKNDNFLSGNVLCPDDCLPLQEESNEILEFLGDAVLNLVIAHYLCERYPQVNEGFLTVMRTKLVNGNMLAFLAKKLEFSKFLVISKQIEQNNGRENKNILEDAFEAFLAAIYLDFNKDNCDGFSKVHAFITNVFEAYIEFSDLVKTKKNPKDILTKQCQAVYQWLPKFLEMDVEEKNNKKIHTVCVKDNNNNIISIGKGHTKKAAEIDGAQKAIVYFGWSDA